VTNKRACSVARIQIKGGEFPIGKIFSKEFVFRIPLYQRPYAWQQEQTEELLDDLLGFLGSGTEPINDLNPYFLGSIVVIKEDHKPDAEVVDGQQRLTTLTILLSAIRSLLTNEDAKGLTDYIYEKGNPIEETPDRFRLTLRERDAEFFRDYVQKEGQIEKLRALNPGKLSDSRNNIRNNTAVLVDRLKKFSPDHCKRLAQFIIKQCYLVVVSTPDFASAYRIFMVLNNRGLDLSHSDILKSDIIGHVPAAEQEKYGDRWEETEELLGREAFIDLFSHIRMIYRKAKLKGTVLDEFRQIVMKQVADPKKLVDDVLVPFAEAYSNIKDADYESESGADEINRLLKWLGRIDNMDWVPPAILYMAKHGNDTKALNRFFTDLERLAAIQMLLRATINERIDRYGRVITAIEKGEDLYKNDSPLQLTAAEQSEAREALDGDVYNMLPKLRTYILLRLDSALSGGGATYDYSLITVEHVLPQNPKAGSQWETWWPDPAVRANMVHLLGNLALLTRRKNASASNFDFEKKKTSYFTKGGVSPFAITTQVVKEQAWTPIVVQQRQKALLDKLKALWRLRGLILIVPQRVEVKTGSAASFPVTVAREIVEGGVKVEFEAPKGLVLHNLVINADQSSGQASVSVGKEVQEQDYPVKAMASCDTVTATHQNIIVRVIRG
jgi:hypothetical protein